MNVFRILVTAIIALALIAIFYGLLPYLWPSQDAIRILSEDLEGAQINQGKLVFSEIKFASGNSMTANIFEKNNTSVTFQCNNPKNCCNEDDKCGLIEWDERQILFNSQKTIKTSARCSLEEELFSCRIYFGDTPAQVEFKSLELKNNLLKAKIRNSGDKPVLFGQLKINVYQKYFSDGVWKRLFLENQSKTLPMDSLLEGEETEMQAQLELGSGDFELEAIATGQDAGFDKNILAIKSNPEEKCFADYCSVSETRFYDNACITKCYCKECLLGSSCEEKIKALSPAELGLPSATDLAGIEAEILGSNEIEFVLDSKYC